LTSPQYRRLGGNAVGGRTWDQVEGDQKRGKKGARRRITFILTKLAYEKKNGAARKGKKKGIGTSRTAVRGCFLAVCKKREH